MLFHVTFVSIQISRSRLNNRRHSTTTRRTRCPLRFSRTTICRRSTSVSKTRHVWTVY